MEKISDYAIFKELARNNLVSWFSNFASWQGATNAHSLSSVIEERRGQGAKGQTMGKLFLAGSLMDYTSVTALNHENSTNFVYILSVIRSNCASQRYFLEGIYFVRSNLETADIDHG